MTLSNTLKERLYPRSLGLAVKRGSTLLIGTERLISGVSDGNEAIAQGAKIINITDVPTYKNKWKPVTAY